MCINAHLPKAYFPYVQITVVFYRQLLLDLVNFIFGNLITVLVHIMNNRANQPQRKVGTLQDQLTWKPSIFICLIILVSTITLLFMIRINGVHKLRTM